MFMYRPIILKYEIIIKHLNYIKNIKNYFLLGKNNIQLQQIVLRNK